MVTRMQAAFLLNVPLPTFDEYVDQGKLRVRFIDASNVAFFDESDILRLKQESTSTPPQPTVAVANPSTELAKETIKLLLRWALKERPTKSQDSYKGAFSLEGARGISDLSVSTLRKDIREGKLKAKKIEGQWRIKRADLHTYLKSEWDRNT